MESLSTNSDTPKYSTNGYFLGTQSKPNFKRYLSIEQSDICQRVFDKCQQLIKKQGVYSTTVMNAAGFYYTGKEDTVRCNNCELEVCGWTLDTKPFTIHAQRSPTCPFVRSILPGKGATPLSMVTLTSAFSMSSENDRPSKRLKTETTHKNYLEYGVTETETLKQIRRRTFSHWPHQISPSRAQMIEAGFFKCNINDRVICLYCNIICQQWTPHLDDPWEIHKTLSPKCPYIIEKLMERQISSLNSYSSQWNSQLEKTAYHENYIRHDIRHASFSTWSNENFSCIDDLAKAGFFYTGNEDIVICFYCNGAFQNWKANDNPVIEHVHWYPHCAYANQLYNSERYRKIEELKRHRKEHDNYQELNCQLETSDVESNDTLSDIISARLDLPISQSLLNRNFSMSIIKRCWEYQFISKRDDFASDSDLLIACMILQKEDEYTNGKEVNVIVPGEYMKKFREQEQMDIK